MNKTSLEKIERLRARVLESQDVNNRFYDKLVAELGLKPNSTDEDLLFEAVFNSPSQSDFERIVQNTKL
jgi:hypothetical protein